MGLTYACNCLVSLEVYAGPFPYTTAGPPFYAGRSYFVRFFYGRLFGTFFEFCGTPANSVDQHELVQYYLARSGSWIINLIMPPSQAKRWVFTLNNPTNEEQHSLYTLGEAISADGDQSELTYLIFGDEVGEQGTPHLQGYLCLRNKKRLPYLKTIPGLDRAHLRIARGTHVQASDYCKKDESYHEWGTTPVEGGSAPQFEQLRNWIASQDQAPTIRDVWEVYPNLAARYRSAVLECIALFSKGPSLVQGTLRPWQARVNDLVSLDPDDRKIIFVVDPNGNEGKSWLCRYWLSHRGGTQFLSVGKRDDIAYAIDPSNDLFVFDIPRGSMQYLQYGVLEQLKNRLVFSTKYMSTTKVLPHNCHVVVFSNEDPDREALTTDRYQVINVISL